MTAVTKFMFDVVFEPGTDPTSPSSADNGDGDATGTEETVEDAEELEEEEEELPGYSEAQLEQVKAEAFEAGKLEGAKEASETIEKETLQTLQAISQHITELFGQQERANSVLLRDGIDIAATIAKKLFPAMNEQNSLGEVDRLVEHTLLRLIEEPRVVIRANPDLMEALAERVDGLKAGAGYEGRIVLKEDAALAYGDCRMEWGDGSAERNVRSLWASIDDILNGNLGADRNTGVEQETVEVSALPGVDGPGGNDPNAGPDAGPGQSEPDTQTPVSESEPVESGDSDNTAPPSSEEITENSNETAVLGAPEGEDVVPPGDGGIVGENQQDNETSPDEDDSPENTPDSPSA